VDGEIAFAAGLAGAVVQGCPADDYVGLHGRRIGLVPNLTKQTIYFGGRSLASASNLCLNGRGS
jgi:hypothetical protein